MMRVYFIAMIVMRKSDFGNHYTRERGENVSVSYFLGTLYTHTHTHTGVMIVLTGTSITCGRLARHHVPRVYGFLFHPVIALANKTVCFYISATRLIPLPSARGRTFFDPTTAQVPI